MIHPVSRKSFVVPFLQLAFFAMAFGTTLTRITDNKHHPADLVAGALIGMLMQVVQGSAKRLRLGCVNILPGSAWL